MSFKFDILLPENTLILTLLIHNIISSLGCIIFSFDAKSKSLRVTFNADLNLLLPILQCSIFDKRSPVRKGKCDIVCSRIESQFLK